MLISHIGKSVQYASGLGSGHAAFTSLYLPYAAGGSPATRVPRSAAWRASARPGGLAPSAWGKRRPRCRELLLRAPLEQCA